MTKEQIIEIIKNMIYVYEDENELLKDDKSDHIEQLKYENEISVITLQRLLYIIEHR